MTDGEADLKEIVEKYADYKRDAAFYQRRFREVMTENAALQKLFRRTFHSLTLVGVVKTNFRDQSLDIDGGSFQYRVKGPYCVGVAEGSVVLIVGNIIRIPDEESIGYLHVELRFLEVLAAPEEPDETA